MRLLVERVRWVDVRRGQIVRYVGGRFSLGAVLRVEHDGGQVRLHMDTKDVLVGRVDDEIDVLLPLPGEM